MILLMTEFCRQPLCKVKYWYYCHEQGMFLGRNRPIMSGIPLKSHPNWNLWKQNFLWQYKPGTCTNPFPTEKKTIQVSANNNTVHSNAYDESVLFLFRYFQEFCEKSNSLSFMKLQFLYYLCLAHICSRSRAINGSMIFHMIFQAT